MRIEDFTIIENPEGPNHLPTKMNCPECNVLAGPKRAYSPSLTKDSPLHLNHVAEYVCKNGHTFHLGFLPN